MKKKALRVLIAAAMLASYMTSYAEEDTPAVGGVRYMGGVTAEEQVAESDTAEETAQLYDDSAELFAAFTDELGIEYSVLSGSAKTMKVSKYTGTETDITIPDKVTYNETEYTVTEIGSNAFKGDTSITKIFIPNTVTKISSYAFSDCTSLETAEFSEGLATIDSYAFQKCSQLKSIALPSTVQTIGNYAFQECTSLSSFTFGEELKKIPAGIFKACTSLARIDIPASVTEVASNAFYGCGALNIVYFKGAAPKLASDSFKDISADAVFYYNLSHEDTFETLREAEDKNGEKIYAFDSFDDYFIIENGVLTGINTSLITEESPARKKLFVPDMFIDEPVTSVTANAFADAQDAEVVVLPMNVTALNNAAFPPAMKELYFRGSCPTGISQIADGVTIYVTPENKRSFEESSSYGARLNTYTYSMFDFDVEKGIVRGYAKENKNDTNSVNIPEKMYGTTVVCIAAEAFEGYKYIPNVEIPPTVKLIGAEAFRDCINLATINSTDGSANTANTIYADYIGIGAFEHCIRLKEITLEDVSIIDMGAFFNCRELDKLTVKGNPEFDGNIKIDGKTEFATALANEIYYKWIKEPETLKDSYIKNIDGIDTEVTVDTKGAYIAADAFCGNLVYGNDPSTDGTKDVAPVLKGGVTLENVGVIAKFAFNGTGIEKITIPSGVKVINGASFAFCPDLSEVVLPEGLLSINGGSNYSKGNADREKACDGAFAGCESLVSIELPESVEILGSLTFADSGIQDISFKGDKVTKLAYGTFRNCSKLENMTIPSSITEISDSTNSNLGVFQDCANLTNVTLPGSLSYIGKYAFKSCSKLADISCASGKLTDTLTEIGEEAFSGCKMLAAEKPLQLPDTVVRINKNAFKDCTGLSLKDGKLSEGLTAILDSAFYNCKSLTALSIPPQLSEIGKSAFAATGIETLTIPETLSIVGDSAFSNSKNLTTVRTADSEKTLTVGKQAFSNCTALDKLSLSRKKITIGESAFSGCTALASIDISNVNSIDIGKTAFQTCTALTSSGLRSDIEATFGAKAYTGSGLTGFTVPDNVTALPEGMFYQCKALSNVKLNNALKTISGSESNKGAFQECSSLKTIELPESITDIQAYAFMDSGLEEIKLPDSVTTIKTNSFAGCKNLKELKLGKNTVSIEGSYKPDKNDDVQVDNKGLVNEKTIYGAFLGCTALESIDFPESIRNIGAFAFEGSGLKSVTIPDGITVVSDGAFYKCENLENIIIHDEVTMIGKYAFANCPTLQEVEIPGSVTTVNKKAFAYDKALETVRIGDVESESITTFGSGAFSDCENLAYMIFSGKIPRYNADTFGEAEKKPTILYFSRLFDDKNASDKNWQTNFTMVAIDEQFDYEENSDGTYNIKKYKGELPIAIIPAAAIDSKGKGVAVTGISANAFDGNLVKTVSIPKSVTNISNDVFFGAEKLEKINVSSLNSSFSAENGILYDNEGTTLVYCPANMIGTVQIGAGVTRVLPGAFCNNSLTAINVSGDNTYYSSSDGVLFSKDATELVVYPNEKSPAYTVGSGVTKVADYAFTGDNMTITFDTLTAPEIGENAIPEKTTIRVYGDATGFDGASFGDFVVQTIKKPIINAIEKSDDGTVYVTYHNYASSPVAGKTFAAIYKNGLLVQVTAEQDLSIESGKEELKSFVFTGEGDVVKVFIWDSFAGMVPVDEAKSQNMN